MCIRDRSKSEDNIAYYGFRPQDSLNLHEAFSKKGTYPFRQPPHSLYMLIEMTRERYKHRLRSVGMTARFKDGPYEFDSCFESGNLDVAVKAGEKEYDLYMRTDSNTRGHHQWFYFAVKAEEKGSVRFNVLNFTKRNSLYTQGMRIAIYSEKKAQRAALGELPKLYAGWHRGGENITYRLSKLTHELYQRARIV
eukprot:TRINITY_DN3875_c0_g1_i1.p2 TRINITY_DN3875_c0_g1~~TRINITY_DN3875_c0_g1_i1.p2  ORF type:complete len:194 (+),score=48.48 TRINITY_DN3875_c0_g1_i1:73-654(+)